MAIHEDSIVRGVLHLFVACDWGEEVDLERAKTLAPAENYALSRRKRTPTSITYRPAPLHFSLAPVRLPLPEFGGVDATTEAVVFDFAAASVALHVPWEASAAKVGRLAAGLALPENTVETATAVLRDLYERLRPAIQNPRFSEMYEEYFVFELSPDDVNVDDVLGHAAPWLAGLVRLEADPLSSEEVAEALRHRIRYGVRDLFVADWAAAVLVDVDCRETLDVVEFANLQLLEFREIDNRLDDQLATTAAIVHRLARTRLPFWKPYTAQHRRMGDLKVEANAVFERTQNALKLVGDQYLARVYNLLAARFCLAQWQQSIQASLEVVEGAYRVLADQASAWRMELLELLIVLLIVLEIVLSLLGA